MEPITLAPITAENFRECIRLKTQPEQESFVATNVFSIAEAAGEILVGFVLLGRDSATDYDWIIRFMIGAEHQGQG